MDYILTKEEMGYFEYPIAEKCMIKNTLYERKNKSVPDQYKLNCMNL